MAEVYEWRKSPQDRFVHLFVRGDRISLCGNAKSPGQKIKDFDKTMKHGSRRLGVDLIQCPLCRRMMRSEDNG